MMQPANTSRDYGVAPTGYRLPDATRLGTVRLQVSDLARSVAYYRDLLGLRVLHLWSYPGALFMSAGGYHHHLGTNTWATGARVPTESDARLLEWETVVPSSADIDSAVGSVRAAGYDAGEGVVTDPWGTSLRLTAAS